MIHGKDTLQTFCFVLVMVVVAVDPSIPHSLNLKRETCCSQVVIRTQSTTKKLVGQSPALEPNSSSTS
jgi:hypothetical protein